MRSMIYVGVIGYGYWGPNLVRNFVELPDVTVHSVADLRTERLKLVQSRFPTISVTTDYRELLANPQIDAVAIATPVSSHYDLVMEALKAGKHVLVEKPLAATTEQAKRIVDEAARLNKLVMVDHTFVYTGAVRLIQDAVRNKTLGEIYYYDSVRINLGLFQHDVNVIWDLAVHDLAILDYIFSEKVLAVSATGMGHISGQPENIAYLTLFLENNIIAHIHVNWLAPVKIRRTLISGSKKMIVYDDLEPSEKIKIYDTGVTVNNDSSSVYQMLINYRTGDMWSPRVDLTEALKTELAHFVDCIANHKQPITDGEAGLRVVQMTEAASESLAARGRLIEFASSLG